MVIFRCMFSSSAVGEAALLFNVKEAITPAMAKKYFAD